MENRVLIMKVGPQQERQWKSIVRSGVDKAYLLVDQENPVEHAVAKELEKRAQLCMLKCDKKAVEDVRDFDGVEIPYVAIMERELRKDPRAVFIVDVTGCDNLYVPPIFKLGGAYPITITYVPPEGTEAMPEIATEDEGDVGEVTETTMRQGFTRRPTEEESKVLLDCYNSNPPEKADFRNNTVLNLVKLGLLDLGKRPTRLGMAFAEAMTEPKASASARSPRTGAVPRTS